MGVVFRLLLAAGPRTLACQASSCLDNLLLISVNGHWLLPPLATPDTEPTPLPSRPTPASDPVLRSTSLASATPCCIFWGTAHLRASLPLAPQPIFRATRGLSLPCIALPIPHSNSPYTLQLPEQSPAQPTRNLLFPLDHTLCRPSLRRLAAAIRHTEVMDTPKIPPPRDEGERQVLQELELILARLQMIRADRANYVRSQDVRSLYDQTIAQVRLLNDTRKGKKTEENRGV